MKCRELAKNASIVQSYITGKIIHMQLIVYTNIQILECNARSMLENTLKKT